VAFIIPFIPAIVGAGVAIVGGMQKNKQAQGAAAAMEANARSTRQGAAAEEEAQRRQNAMAMGEVRASAAQSGFDPNTGSLAALQFKTAGELELEALTTRYRGELQAIGFDYDARATRASGKVAQSQGYLNAFSTLASGAVSSYLNSSQIKPYAGGMSSLYGGNGRSGD